MLAPTRKCNMYIFFKLQCTLFFKNMEKKYSRLQVNLFTSLILTLFNNNFKNVFWKIPMCEFSSSIIFLQNIIGIMKLRGLSCGNLFCVTLLIFKVLLLNIIYNQIQNILQKVFRSCSKISSLKN